jgi:hypothetical protein
MTSMAKNLLLGSTAALATIATAQAADLPVKAKPVEYVKVCTVYGVGFYYIPGTDACLKVGGHVRLDIGIFAGGNHAPYFVGAAARDNREDTPFYQTRSRGVISFDARSQTEWGTMRAYLRAGWEMNSAPTVYGTQAGGFVDTTYRGATYWDRAFMQFAGLTVGKTQSFFDFYANALSYVGQITAGSDTGLGINLVAYTFEFGGGFSGTISLEDTVHRRTGIWDATTRALVTGSPALGVPPPNYGDYAAQTYPDVVANVHVDQPWGSAQIMAALHDADGACYGGVCNAGPGLLNNGPDAVGWAVGGGVMFNLPWAQGDQLWIQGTYAEGAVSYLGLNKFAIKDAIAIIKGGASFGLGGDGNTMQGWAFDGIYQTGGPVELTEGWQFNIAAQHYWTPALRTSVFAGYVKLEFPGDHAYLAAVAVLPAGPVATISAGNGARGAFCTGNGMNAAPVGGTGFFPFSAGGCNPDFAVWSVGTRTVWSPVRNLDIGVEVLYQRFDQNMDGLWLLPAAGGRAAGFYEARDQDVWSGLIRFQRNFWP